MRRVALRSLSMAGAVADPRSIPVVDVRALRDPEASPAARAECAQAVDVALRTSSFMYVTGHGVCGELCRTVRDAAADFFNLPLREKSRILLRGEETAFRGYQPMEHNVTQGAPDLHEALDFYRDVLPESRVVVDGVEVLESAVVASENCGVNQWPDDVDSLRAAMAASPALAGRPGGFRAVYEDYIARLLDVGGSIMEGVATGLGLPRAFFRPHLDRSFWVLRAIRYPIDPVASDDRSVGVGEHTDYGVLTLITADGGPGLDGCLEVRDRDTGQWVAVPPMEGAFTVNVGDCLAHWSAGAYRSTAHRVVAPVAAEGQSEAARTRGRVAVAFFYEPNYDADIRSIDGADATVMNYGAHLRSKVVGNFAGGD